ncbi:MULTISPECIES: transcriptional regulator NrdR [unclassified Guyparkeria]|uniref:transcriptional regulator NrdR n=1 Tax=unclassified Guyparkeria TaxID=2626246 RepID=UPI0007333AC2|nr:MULTISPECIES: transcriptional regulator NrdR [unclassified Guyparkeria]KTG16375.1 NrdR family transcriptional regulator [Guyparkeria sp. XI15]OAE85315.1 NrdR family transcriptional regulator [Guyparkeria sp. WRN-7]
MRCAICGNDDTRVIDSRSIDAGEGIRRRRECAACGQRFTTYERADRQMPRVVKSNGARQNFDERKLRDGLMRALEKRPVPTRRVEEAIEQIERQLRSRGEREIAAREIGEMVMAQLRRLDHVAYIRFASVYLSFDSVEAFREAIESLANDVISDPDHQLPLIGDAN